MGSTSPIVPVRPSSTTLTLNPKEHNLREAIAEDGAGGDKQPLLASSHLSTQNITREGDARRGCGDIKDGDVGEGIGSHSANSSEMQGQDYSPMPLSNLSTYFRTTFYLPNPHFRPALAHVCTRTPFFLTFSISYATSIINN